MFNCIYTLTHKSYGLLLITLMTQPAETTKIITRKLSTNNINNKQRVHGISHLALALPD